MSVYYGRALIASLALAGAVARYLPIALPLYLLGPDANTRQFQAFLLLAKDFLFAEEIGSLSKASCEASLVLLQQVSVKLTAASRYPEKAVELKLKWIHLILTQELRRMREDDFPVGFEALANKVSSLVAFMIPESIHGTICDR